MSQALLQTSQRVMNATTVTGGTLQRKCGCGQHTIGGSTCTACSEEQKKILRRSDMDHRPAERVPPIVRDVLSSSGQPLDTAARTFMEARFGHDFSQVRVHTDAKAAESARAVNALAYTVGQDVVFGTGQFVPSTRAGQRLLAHELTHVVQQESGTTAFRGSLSLGQPNDAAEQEADRVADAALGGQPTMPAVSVAGPATVIKREGIRDPGTPPPPSPGPSPPATTATCGPDVTTQVTAAVGNARSTFAGWSNSDKRGACDALDSLSTGAVAWDIVELHNNAWILGYRPACATQGATPPCGSTIKVGTGCHYAGSPNYVIFGVMCKLCNSHFTAISDTAAANRFTQAQMEYWINFYKGTGPLGTSTPSGNFGPSRDWAIAGYGGWPATTAPGGDRNNCAPNCPTAYTGGSFHVNWVPKGVF